MKPNHRRRTRRSALLAVLAALFIVAGTAAAGAEIDDSPIPEAIPPGDLTVSLESLSFFLAHEARADGA